MFNKFEYVYAVYTHKSFTKAAQALYISQPSLSAAIKKIETKIGAPIFERTGHEIRLTEIGEEYIKSAEQILFVQNNFKTILKDLYSLNTGKINIGGPNYLCSHIIPEIINNFVSIYPNIEISLNEANTTLLCENLEKEKIDILIDSFDKPEKNQIAFPLSSEKILLCVPSAWEINNILKKYQIPFENNRLLLNEKVSPVPIEKFGNTRFVLLKNYNDMYKRAQHIFQSAKINPPISFYVDQLNISYNLARSSMGACFVTDTIVNCSLFPENLTFYKLDEQYNSRILSITHKKNKYCTKAMQEFIRIATETIKK